VKIKDLKKELSNSEWYSALKAYYGEEQDPHLPDVVIYDSLDSWRAGMVYHNYTSPKGGDQAQLLFDERNIWVVLFSDTLPVFKHNVPIVGLISDTVAIHLHKTSLAYVKPIGDAGLFGLVGSVVSILSKLTAGSTPTPAILVPKDSVWDIKSWRKIVNNNDNINDNINDSIYIAQTSFPLSMGTVNRVSATPILFRNGKMDTSIEVGSSSKLLFVDATFANADPSWINAAIGLGAAPSTPNRDIFAKRWWYWGNWQTNAYLLALLYFHRPMLPYDNRCWGLALGIGITGNLLEHKLLAFQFSISYLGGIFGDKAYNGFPGSIKLLTGMDFSSVGGRLFVGLSYDLF
jgi:hypothetical protein